jgi:hypothetical protein
MLKEITLKLTRHSHLMLCKDYFSSKYILARLGNQDNLKKYILISKQQTIIY